MAINIEVSKTGNENNMGVIRRFSRKVQDAGIILGVKARRYAERSKSKNTVRKAKLKRIARRTEVERLIKLGKMQPRAER
jgi:ribosomal protein S21